MGNQHFWACLHCSGTHAVPLAQGCPPLLWAVAPLGQEHTYEARGRLIKREEESLSFLCTSCSPVRKLSILDSFLPESQIAGLRLRFRKPFFTIFSVLLCPYLSLALLPSCFALPSFLIAPSLLPSGLFPFLFRKPLFPLCCHNSVNILHAVMPFYSPVPTIPTF